jgi:Rod binding domain-containing protein
MQTNCYASAIAQSAIPTVSQNGKSSQPSSVSNTPAGRKLRHAAAEFEGMLISSLWKSMKSTFATPDDDSSDPAHDTLDDLGIQTMSNAIANAGGLGLGKLLLKHLEPMLARSMAQNDPISGKASTPSADNPM